MAMLELTALSKSFGGLVAVDKVDLVVEQGELVSLIGPNGAGKTTLFNLVTGIYPPSSGRIVYNGQAITGYKPSQVAAQGIARTFQQGRVFAGLSVADNVRLGAHVHLHAQRPGAGLSEKLGTVGKIIAPWLRLPWEAALAVAQPPSVQREEAQVADDARAILRIFGERLTPRWDDPALSLSYANRRRTEIARALALKPRLLMLDEPCAGMNPAETKELQELIAFVRREFDLTILLIEHKLDLVMQLSDRVVVLDHGAKIAEGRPAEVRANPAVIEAYLGKSHA